MTASFQICANWWISKTVLQDFSFGVWAGATQANKTKAQPGRSALLLGGADRAIAAST